MSVSNGHWKDGGVSKQAPYKGERCWVLDLKFFQMLVIRGIDNLITTTTLWSYGYYHDGFPIVSIEDDFCATA
jgi:hypothetical protein